VLPLTDSQVRLLKAMTANVRRSQRERTRMDRARPYPAADLYVLRAAKLVRPAEYRLCAVCPTGSSWPTSASRRRAAAPSHTHRPRPGPQPGTAVMNLPPQRPRHQYLRGSTRRPNRTRYARACGTWIQRDL